MNRLLTIAIITVCATVKCQEVEEVEPPPPEQMSQGEIWPLPQQVHYGQENRTIRRGSIVFVFQGQRDVDCDVLDFARKTYQKRWFFPGKMPSASPGGINLVIRLDKCPEKDEYPQQGMNEEYRLRVPIAGDVILEADEVWGILRGLETFSQLIFESHGAYFIRTATIHDWPEYSVRGILIDTSRHYIPKATLLRQIDIMAQNKMNVLHWHIVDSQSFPYVSRKFPNLSKKGAYSPKHVYSKYAVQEIIDHARLRGVRVMPEFDTPGHVGSWKGELGFLADCRDQSGHPMPSNIVDPSLERNYGFLRQFFDEILQVFPERFIHLGGDEVNFWTQDCWANNPKIIDFMDKRGIKGNITALEDLYFSRLQEIMADLFGPDEDARMVFWQEVFDRNNPHKKAIAHIWYSPNATERSKELSKVTEQGSQVILSSCWYLNYISYGADWKEGTTQYYYCNPRDFNGTEEQKQLVLGGIAAMWGEFVDSTNLEARLWPRASAVAERLWSAANQTTDAELAWPRLHEHRCRMIARGYRAQPANGPDFCPVEFEEMPLDNSNNFLQQLAQNWT